MSIHAENMDAKKRGFDKSLPLKVRETELASAMDLRSAAKLPETIDAGWGDDSPNHRDPIARELQRVRRKIDAGMQ